MTHQFTAPIRHNEVYMFATDDFYPIGLWQVHWSVEFEMRDYGIKSTIITISKITGEYEHGDEDPIVKDFNSEHLSSSWKFIIDDELKMKDGELSPSEVEVDFNATEINIR